MGLAHRDSILKNIASDFEQWNHLVSITCYLHDLIISMNLMKFYGLKLLIALLCIRFISYHSFIIVIKF